MFTVWSLKGAVFLRNRTSTSRATSPRPRVISVRSIFALGVCWILCGRTLIRGHPLREHGVVVTAKESAVGRAAAFFRADVTRGLPSAPNRSLIAGMSDHFRIESIEQNFGVTLPDRYRRFLRDEREAHSGKMADLPNYGEPIEIYFDGVQLESFLHDDWPDFDDDGVPYGHPSATEVDFEETFKGWVPLATIGEEESQILLCNVTAADCPVAMWEHEVDEALPVADSLDEFLSALKD